MPRYDSFKNVVENHKKDLLSFPLSKPVCLKSFTDQKTGEIKLRYINKPNVKDLLYGAFVIEILIPYVPELFEGGTKRPFEIEKVDLNRRRLDILKGCFLSNLRNEDTMIKVLNQISDGLINIKVITFKTSSPIMRILVEP